MIDDSFISNRKKFNLSKSISLSSGKKLITLFLNIFFKAKKPRFKKRVVNIKINKAFAYNSLKTLLLKCN